MKSTRLKFVLISALSLGTIDSASAKECFCHQHFSVGAMSNIMATTVGHLIEPNFKNESWVVLEKGAKLDEIYKAERFNLSIKLVETTLVHHHGTRADLECKYTIAYTDEQKKRHEDPEAYFVLESRFLKCD